MLIVTRRGALQYTLTARVAGWRFKRHARRDRTLTERSRDTNDEAGTKLLGEVDLVPRIALH